jgi:hypothetical protein
MGRVPRRRRAAPARQQPLIDRRQHPTPRP